QRVRWRSGPRVPFFFQAEDGIRDRNVTGVQTCALPISVPPLEAIRTELRRTNFSGRTVTLAEGALVVAGTSVLSLRTGRATDTRSEERRVGKECGSRRRPRQKNETRGRHARDTAMSRAY